MKPENSYKKERGEKKSEKDQTTQEEKAAVRKAAFYSRLRKLGLLLSAVSGALLTLPVKLPPLVTTLAALLGTTGGLLISIAKIMTGSREEITESANETIRPATPGLKRDVDKKLFSKRYFAKNFS